jgi:hypothetical protein
MGLEALNNVSADKIKKIDGEIKKLHIQIKETNNGLCNRMKDIIDDMETWDGLKDELSNGKGFLPGEQGPRF